MMCGPISDEELWGVPPEKKPEPDPERNYFDEAQPIKHHEEDEIDLTTNGHEH